MVEGLSYRALDLASFPLKQIIKLRQFLIKPNYPINHALK